MVQAVRQSQDVTDYFCLAWDYPLDMSGLPRNYSAITLQPTPHDIRDAPIDLDHIEQLIDPTIEYGIINSEESIDKPLLATLLCDVPSRIRRLVWISIVLVLSAAIIHYERFVAPIIAPQIKFFRAIDKHASHIPRIATQVGFDEQLRDSLNCTESH